MYITYNLAQYHSTEYHFNRVALATFTIPFAFLVLQTSECQFGLILTVDALTVFILKEGPRAEGARRVLNYSKLHVRFVMNNQNNVLVLLNVPFHYTAKR